MDIIKKNELKEKFYTDLTAYEIQNQLGISNNEYNKLLILVKKELGLPSQYKRNPKKFKTYGKDKYYVAKTMMDEIEILTYAPTIDYAENFIKKLDTRTDITLGQATDESMKKLINKYYFTKGMKWDEIIQKLKLNYHDFYRLLNELKKEKGVTGTRTSNANRYIYKNRRKNSWKIQKTKKGRVYDYGDYNDINLAIKIRNYLEDINWSDEKWDKEKDKVIEEIIVE